jgi:hypothetical protein
MDPTVLAWALSQSAGSRAAALAAAYTGGTELCWNLGDAVIRRRVGLASG